MVKEMPISFSLRTMCINLTMRYQLKYNIKIERYRGRLRPCWYMARMSKRAASLEKVWQFLRRINKTERRLAIRLPVVHRNMKSILRNTSAQMFITALLIRAPLEPVYVSLHRGMGE